MLFLKELKKTVFSVTFLIFVFASIYLPNSQEVLNFSTPITVPKPGENYGTQTKELPELIMPSAIARLISEYETNSYTTYPIGFYKAVRLSENEQKQMSAILDRLTENKQLTYEQFKACMKDADSLIGGSSYYSESRLIKTFGRVPITYEEALAQYELSKSTDHFTGTYARLFCDYIGIPLSILPVFLAVAICLKDRRSRASELIYMRNTSSARLLFTRFLAILAAVMLPVMLLSYISNSSVWGMYGGMPLDYMAPFYYALGWLLPSAMVSAAVGIFFTELTGTPIAIVIQSLWWFIDLNAGAARLDGNYALFQLTLRHNKLGNTQAFIDGFPILAANRLLFAGIAVLLMFAAVWIYEQKRRGNLNGFRTSKKTAMGLANRKNKPEA